VLAQDFRRRKTWPEVRTSLTNAMEALRQDVAEETADKLTCCERHDFVARSVVGTIILVIERDAVLVERNQSAIGDGNTVGVARQIGKYRGLPASCVAPARK
jgi:hypothetical protein